jgi:hypothetical protein
MIADTAMHSGSRQAFNRTKQLALPAPPASAAGTAGSTTTPAPEPHFKRPTATEMAAKRARGECYNYTKKFTKEHLEVCPIKGIFLLEMETSVAVDLLDNAMPHISLNAIIGNSTAEMMKLFIRLGAKTVMALVDSGSTHLFISTEAACHLDLELIFHTDLQVRVASTDVCQGIQFFINKEAFIMDFFIIPLAGYEMVLGVQWLRTLGPILWDFANVCMSYWHNDHRIDWRGVATLGATTVVHTLASTDLMATLL